MTQLFILNNFVLILIIFITFTNFITAQISPGELSKYHSKYEGISNCTKCHEFGKKVTNLKCLECHNLIQKLISDGLGYHSNIEVKGNDCFKCHSDHNGKNFQIIKIDSKSFNHSKTKFVLDGEHLKIECKKCHQSKFINDSNLKKRSRTFLGLNIKCIGCHEDVHQKTLDEDCSVCHGTENFKPASRFEHNKTKYKLTGRHNKILCIKCHSIERKKGKEYQKFVGLQFDNCIPCHTDIHNSKFDKNCSKCHNTNSFTDIDKSLFDHSKTNYELKGLHKSVECNECHKKNITSKLKYQKCNDCHKDYHKGQFKNENQTKDCVECHNENGFIPSLFSIEEHNKSKFKLTGSHLSIPCIKCHYKNENWNFINVGLKCIECHKDVHQNEISEKFLGQNICEGCHIADNWKSINFDHNKTKFVLQEKHSRVTCGDCHFRNFNSKNKIYKFSSLKGYCEECHDDIHYSQFKVGESSNCENCHSFVDWNASKFNHNQTRFQLTGAHAKIDCSRCHKQIVISDIKYVKYRLEDFKCSVCHP